MPPASGEVAPTVDGRAGLASGADAPAGGFQVLHVDDEPEFAAMAAQFLQRQDDRLDVATATSASEAHSHLRSNRVDCVVSDYDMPGEDGIEFLETVRADTPDLPFILFTGKGSEEIASRAISAGVTEYLQKGGGTSQYAVLANRITNAVEQYRARHAFEASQERLSLFIEQSPLGVIEWDEGFRVRRMNEQAEAILGYAESDLAGEPWERIVPESDLDDVDAVVSALLEDRGGYHSLNENVRGDGDRVTCEWHNRVITDRDGTVVAIFSQFRDVTERVERERELARQRSLLRAQRESVLDGQLVVDEHGEIVSYNARFVDMWGLPEAIVERGDDAEALASVLDELADPDEFLATVEYLYDHPEETARDEVELADGRVFDRYTTPLVGDDDTYFGRLWTFRDITDRKERERALEESEARFRSLAESATDAILTIDAESTVRYANPAVERLFGYAPEEVEGEPLTMLLPERHRDRHRDAIQRYLETGERRLDWTAVELPGLHKDGHEVDLRISFSELASGREPRFTGIIRG